MSKLWTAMLEAQKEIKHAIKDAKNPHLKNRYASLNSVLDEVKPVLNKHGIVITQKILVGQPGRVAVQTMLTEATTGESVCDDLQVPVKHKFKDGVDLGPDAQELGSAITYGRRYGLLAMCAIASEDDDGEGAVGRPTADVGGTKFAAAPAAGAQPINEEQKRQLNETLGKIPGWKPLSK